MPTGYTAQLLEKPNMTAREWARICARAFGACIEQRDQDLKNPAPKKVKPNLKPLKEQKKKYELQLKELNTMTQPLRDAYNKLKASEARQYYTKCIKDNDQQQATLDSMTKRIEAWNARASHQELKKFMLNQLEISSCKCYAEYYNRALASVEKDYWSMEVESAKGMIKTYEESIKKEIARADRANDWLVGLETVPNK